MDELSKESNRRINLVWLVLFSLIVIKIFSYRTEESFYIVFLIISLVLGLFAFLAIIIPRHNNFVSAFFLMIIALISNVLFTKFYYLTWIFSPNLINPLTDGVVPNMGVSICSWLLSFVLTIAFVYMLSSSFCKAIIKKTKALICILVSFLLVGIVACIFFFVFPVSIYLSGTKISENINEDTNIQFIDGKYIDNSNELLTTISSKEFYVYISNIPAGVRYGLRILNSDGDIVEEKSTFKYCWRDTCDFYFGSFNNFSNRWNTGEYTFEVISEDGKNLEIIKVGKIVVEELKITAYDSQSNYQCQMWLTLGDSSEKLLRIDIEDGQEQTDIQVVAQCSKDTYDAQIAVGTISQTVQYYGTTIYAGEPVDILGLSGNTSHGYVRLIVGDQVVGEAIINRGFPICDNGNIVEGGQQSDCK